MLHCLRRARIAEAKQFRTLADAIYSASAPLHLFDKDGRGVGLPFYQGFANRMDAVIYNRPAADPSAVLQQSAIESFESHLRRAGLPSVASAQEGAA